MADIVTGAPPDMEKKSSVSVEVNADTSHLEPIGVFIRVTGNIAGFTANEIKALELAMDELVSNAIVHGYKSSPHGKIKLSVSILDSGLMIVMEEQGRAFNPLKIAEPDLDAELAERKIGGLGFFIIRKIVDEIYYEYEENKIKRFTLIKRLG